MNTRLLAIFIAIGLPTLVLYFVFPIVLYYELLWNTAFLLFVIGDSVTTALIQRYENLEEVGSATRAICGRNPSIFCSFWTRILFFGLLLILSIAVVQYEIGIRFEIIAITAIITPLVLTVSGVFVVSWNSYAILREEFAK